MGWYILKEFVENGVSGFSVSSEKRDAIIKLQEAAIKKKFDVLSVFMFDRIGRKEDETPFVVEWFVKQGIEVWSTKEGEQRFDNHTDNLLNYIRLWQAEGESLNTSQRVKTRMNQLTDEGFYTGGNIPIGYRKTYKGRINKKGNPVPDIEIDPNTVDIVKEVFNKTVVEGLGSFVLAKWCNQQGYRTQQENLFQSNTILRMLRNRTYCGYLIRGTHKSPHIPELQIINEKLFEQAQHVLGKCAEKDKSKRQISDFARDETLLSDIVYCGYCGSHMISSVYTDKYTRKDGTVNNRKKLRYICYHRSRKLNDCKGQSAYVSHHIEAIVEQLLNQIFNILKNVQMDCFEKYIKKQIRALTLESSRLKIKRDNLAKECTELNDLIVRAVCGDINIDSDKLSEDILKNEKVIEKNEEDRKIITNNIKDMKRIIKSLSDYYNQFLDWSCNYDLLPKKDKKTIICELFSRIELLYGYKPKIYISRNYWLMIGDMLSKIEVENCQLMG